LQHLGANGSSPTLAIQSRQDLLSRKLDISLLSSPASLAIQRARARQQELTING